MCFSLPRPEGSPTKRSGCHGFPCVFSHLGTKASDATIERIKMSILMDCLNDPHCITQGKQVYHYIILYIPWLCTVLYYIIIQMYCIPSYYPIMFTFIPILILLTYFTLLTYLLTYLSKV